MGSVILEITPLAVGIAASPFPVVPAILLLFTVRPRATAGSFVAGWLVGVGLVCTVAAALASFVELNEETPTWASWTKLVLGVLLILMGLRQWMVRDAKPDPAWMQALDDATPASALRLSLLLSAANPKVALLAAGGGLAIGAAELPLGQVIVALLVFTAIASCTVALPWLLYTLTGERILTPLGRARDWLRAHNATIVAVVLAAIGLLLVIEGLSGL